MLTFPQSLKFGFRKLYSDTMTEHYMKLYIYFGVCSFNMFQRKNQN
jgi:hypothetical protein